MIARGKRGAKRVAPGFQMKLLTSTESAKYQRDLFRSFRASRQLRFSQGRRASLRSALAFGFHIPRLRRFNYTELAHLSAATNLPKKFNVQFCGAISDNDTARQLI